MSPALENSKELASAKSWIFRARILAEGWLLPNMTNVNFVKTWFNFVTLDGLIMPSTSSPKEHALALALGLLPPGAVKLPELNDVDKIVVLGNWARQELGE